MVSRRGAKAMGRGWCGLMSLYVMLGCLSAGWASPPVTLPVGLVAVEQQVPMPTFRLPSVDGDTIDSATLHGKVVVVRFWATW